MKMWSSQLFICFIPFTGMMNSINWPASNIWVFIAQLVEHCSANAETIGSNPVEAPKRFFRAYFVIAYMAITTAIIMSSFQKILLCSSVVPHACWSCCPNAAMEGSSQWAISEVFTFCTWTKVWSLLYQSFHQQGFWNYAQMWNCIIFLWAHNLHNSKKHVQWHIINFSKILTDLLISYVSSKLERCMEIFFP